MISSASLVRSAIAAAALAMVCTGALAAGQPSLVPPFSNESAWGIGDMGNLFVEMAPVRSRDLDTFAVRTFKVDGNPSHAAIVERKPMTLVGGRKYILVVDARADTARTIQVVAQTAQRHPHNAGLDGAMPIGFPYRTFRFDFTVAGTGPQKVDLAFLVGGMTGTVWVRNVRLIDDSAPAA